MSKLVCHECILFLAFPFLFFGFKTFKFKKSVRGWFKCNYYSPYNTWCNLGRDGTSYSSALQCDLVDQDHSCCTGAPDSSPHFLLWVPTQRRRWGKEAQDVAYERVPTGRGGVGNQGRLRNTCEPDTLNCAKATNCSSWPSLNLRFIKSFLLAWK